MNDNTIEYKDHVIRIVLDSDYESPREWDNLGTMYCSHSRYNLGDIQVSSEEDFLYRLGIDTDSSHAVQQKALYNRYISLFLYLYDHSGLSISTGCFPGYWDTGIVGMIVVSKQEVLSEYKWKRLSKKRVDKVLSILKQEVKIYDQCLSGEVFGYIVEDLNGVKLDSCYGFFGNPKESGLIEEAKSYIDSISEEGKE